MNDQPRSGSGPDDDRDATWTNETLPLGVRRELLERELQQFIARRRPGDAMRRSEPGSGSHPVAQGPDEHGA